MTGVIAVMLVQGVLGAADTLYYHEWRYRLPAQREARTELRLHAGRDFIYAVVFSTLPFFRWSGVFAWLLAALLMAEVVITLSDFLVERDSRAAQGGVAAGEFVTHVIMAIVYGGFLATLAPHWWEWTHAASGLRDHLIVPPEWMRYACLLMAAGVFASGVRDLLSSFGVAAAAWPWRPSEQHTN